MHGADLFADAPELAAVRCPVDRPVVRPVSCATVAALYVEPNGVYVGVPGVDPWDEARDARKKMRIERAYFCGAAAPRRCHGTKWQPRQSGFGATAVPHPFRGGTRGTGVDAVAPERVKNRPLVGLQKTA